MIDEKEQYTNEIIETTTRRDVLSLREPGVIARMANFDVLVSIAAELAYMNRAAEVPPTIAEMVMAAQKAVSWGADPTSEIWAWIQVKNNVRKLSVMPHRDYWVRMIAEFGAENGTRFDHDLRYITTQEKKDRGLVESDVAVEITFSNVAAYSKWTNVVIQLTGNGVPHKEAKEIAGPPPLVKAVGVFPSNESQRGSMTKHAKAEKRAYAEAAKRILTPVLRRFKDLTPAGGVEIDVEKIDTDSLLRISDVIEAKIKEEEDNPQTMAAASKTLGFDEDPNAKPKKAKKMSRPIKPAQLRQAIHRRAEKYKSMDRDTMIDHAVQSVINTTFSDENDRVIVYQFLTGETELKEISTGHIWALYKWMGVNDEGVPSEYVIEELKDIVNDMSSDDEQQELFND